jgi:hypothetical protein
MRNFLVILLLVIQNCTISKQEISLTGNYEPAIKNAIIDFRTSSLAKRDSTFLVRFRELDGGIIGVSLYGTVNKFRILRHGNSSRLPNKYIEYKGKLFYWNDENSSADADIIPKLNEYHVLDSLEDISQIVFVHDDAKKTTYYFFCKQNLSRYKKTASNRTWKYARPQNFVCSDK